MSNSIRITRFAVGVVIAAAIGAALFWVVTANDRVAERRNTARAVCANSGGEWVKDAKHEMCVRGEVAGKD